MNRMFIFLSCLTFTLFHLTTLQEGTNLMDNIRDNEKRHNDVIDVPATIDATPAAILEAIEIAVYSHFLYNANMGGKPVTDLTSKGIKTITEYGKENRFLIEKGTTRAIRNVAEDAWGLPNTEWEVELWTQFASVLASEDFVASINNGNGQNAEYGGADK